MKSLIQTTMAVLFFPLSAFSASEVVLSCESYSKAYELKITWTGASAIVDVLNSSADGQFALPLGKFELKNPMDLTSGWVGFEGKIAAGNHVSFKARQLDLAQSDRFVASMAISPRWTDTYEVSNQLECRRN